MKQPTTTADVYISHTPQDRPAAQRLAAALGQLGLRIAKHPAAARLTCVIWSDSAAISPEVQAECAQARKSGFVLPLQTDHTEVPHGIGTLQTLHMDEANGGWSDERLNVVRDEILRAVQGSRLWNATPAAQRGRKRSAMTGTASSMSHTRPQRPTWPRKAWRALAVIAGLTLVTWAALDLQERLSAHHHRDTGLRLMLATEPQPAEALRELNEAVRLRPQDAVAHYHLAQLRVMLGHVNDARASITAALQGGSGLSNAQRDMAQQLLARLNTPEPLPQLPLIEGRHEPSGTWSLDTSGPLRIARAVPPTNAEVQDTRALVQNLFDAEADQRLHAASLLAATPSATSDALPLVLGKALALTRPGRETDMAAAHALSSTLHLALAASALTLTDQRKPLEALLAPISTPRWGQHIGQQAEHLRTRLSQSTAAVPTVRVILTDPRQRPWADHFVAHLNRAGLSGTAIQAPELAGPEHTQIRPMGSSHLGVARWLRQEAMLSSGEKAATVLATRRGAEGRDEYEVWLGREVCTTTQDLAACRPR